MEETKALFKGFGENKPASEWAEACRVPVDALLYYLMVKKLSVEDIFKLRGAEYKQKAPDPKEPSKPLRQTQKDKTQARMYILFALSGYVLPGDDKSCVEVKPKDNNGNQLVFFKGEQIGVYNYRTQTLKLAEGEGLPLDKLELEDAVVYQAGDGKWHPHPRAQKAISVGLIEELDQRAGDLPTQEEYGAFVAEQFQEDL